MKKEFANIRISIEELTDNDELMQMLMFFRHLNKTVTQFQDESYPPSDKYDLKFELNGEKLVLPLHADLYQNFYGFMTQIIEESVEEGRSFAKSQD